MAPIRPLTRRYLIVKGHVQGVGFRWFSWELAEALGVSGWVRNRLDESVELEAEGTPETLDEFVRRLKCENPEARVDEIVSVPRPPKGVHGFEIRR